MRPSPLISGSMNCLHADNIRELVLATFQQLGAPKNHLLAETVLIREGYYYGRSYRAGELIATFVAETATLQFFATDGRLLDSMPCGEEDLAIRRAA